MSVANQAYAGGKQAERASLQNEERDVVTGQASIRKRKLRWVGLLAVCVLVIWLVPFWLITTKNEKQYKATQRELNRSKLQNLIASAMVDAGRGEYEPARQTASDFFTALRTQIDVGETSVFSGAQRESLKPLLRERDDIITLLARSDPAAIERLKDVYLIYRQVISEVPVSGLRIKDTREAEKAVRNFVALYVERSTVFRT